MSASREPCIPYTTSQHSSQCLEAEIAELERVMQLSLDDLTVRPPTPPLYFCNTLPLRRLVSIAPAPTWLGRI